MSSETTEETTVFSTTKAAGIIGGSTFLTNSDPADVENKVEGIYATRLNLFEKATDDAIAPNQAADRLDEHRQALFRRQSPPCLFTRNNVA